MHEYVSYGMYVRTYMYMHISHPQLLSCSYIAIVYDIYHTLLLWRHSICMCVTVQLHMYMHICTLITMVMYIAVETYITMVKSQCYCEPVH